MRKYFNYEKEYQNGQYTMESDYSMQYREDYIVLRDQYNTLKFDCRSSLIAVNDALNNIISTMFGSSNRTDINRMIELLNKKLKDITIISAVNSKETTDYSTKITHTISEKTHIGGRCFRNEDGTYSVVALGYSPYTELNAAAIHNINHELWHLFSNIAPYLYYREDELIHDEGEVYEKVDDCGIDIIDKESGEKNTKKNKKYPINRYYEEYNETLKDILAAIGISRQNGRDVTNILLNGPDTWIESKTSYRRSIPLTQLAIAAFSNYSFENYVNDENCGIVTANITCNNGKKMKVNDFLYGMVFNPFYVEEKFKEIMGDSFSLKKLSEMSTAIFLNNERRKTVSEEHQKQALMIYAKNFSKFFSQKTKKFLEDSSHSKEDVQSITANYISVLEMFCKTYDIDFQQVLSDIDLSIETENNSSELTPTDINEITQRTLMTNPGILGHLVGSVGTIFGRSKGENNRNERNE